MDDSINDSRYSEDPSHYRAYVYQELKKVLLHLFKLYCDRRQLVVEH